MNDSAQAGHWQESLLEHSHFPRGQHELPDRTHEGAGHNPLCGDRVKVQLRVNEDHVIEDIGCLASGCAISIASASMLAESMRGKRPQEALALFEQVHTMLLGGSADALPGDIGSLQLVRRYPSRVKCASLAWHALHHALRGEAGVARTEVSNGH